ncbi:helix-turn-helix domain-containing protein [Streptomyces sp. NPDC056909]|uniref:helix-turn-helix domain-containing protein n=1 Tax=Streptomyces sp. NPDC056909 TaxID=3345963 RepID=UPI0036A6FF81
MHGVFPNASADTPGSGSARAVIGSAFDLLTALRELGVARTSDLQRACGLPRTTVARLLGQLADVGAVERNGAWWRIGATLVQLGSAAPGEPRLRAVARRPLMELAKVTGGLVALSVEVPRGGLIVEVLPGVRPLAVEPAPGMAVRDDLPTATGLRTGRLALIRAQEAAHLGDMRPVLDAGEADPCVSCVAAPLRLSPRDTGAVWVMVPGGDGVSDHVVAATRRTAGLITTGLSAGPRPRGRAPKDRDPRDGRATGPQR